MDEAKTIKVRGTGPLASIGILSASLFVDSCEACFSRLDEFKLKLDRIVRVPNSATNGVEFNSDVVSFNREDYTARFWTGRNGNKTPLDQEICLFVVKQDWPRVDEAITLWKRDIEGREKLQDLGYSVSLYETPNHGAVGAASYADHAAKYDGYARFEDWPGHKKLADR